MIAVDEGVFPPVDASPDRIQLLKQKINDEDYLFEAVQRIAQVLSGEMSGVPGVRRGGRDHER